MTDIDRINEKKLFLILIIFITIYFFLFILAFNSTIFLKSLSMDGMYIFPQSVLLRNEIDTNVNFMIVFILIVCICPFIMELYFQRNYKNNKLITYGIPFIFYFLIICFFLIFWIVL